MAETYDSFLENKVGSLGAWQWFLFFFITIPCNPPLVQYQQLILMTPSHFCDQPQLRAAGWSNDQILNATVPRLPSTGDFDSCHQLMLSDSFSNQSEELPVITNSTPVPCQHGWTYVDDGRTMLLPLPREFDLVCDRKMLIPLVGSAFMFGMIPGPIVAGFLSDKYGRKPVCIISSILAGCIGIASGYLSTSIAVFWVLRLLIGATNSAANVTGYVLCAELTTVRHQNVYNFVFHTCVDLIAGFQYIAACYLAQNWRLATVLVSTTHCVAIIFPFMIPESPRWLLSVDKRKQALSVLKRASEVNHRCRCSSRGPNKPLSDQDVTELMQSLVKPDNEETDDDKTVTWRSLFTNKVYLMRFCCLTFLWVSIMHVFFAIFFFSVKLEGSPYVIAVILACFSLPVIASKAIIYHFFSRKPPLVTGFAVITVINVACAISLQFLSDHSVTVALAIVSYAVTVGTSTMLFTVTTAFFPTGIRNLAMGLMYGLCRVGASLAPLVEKLDDITGLRWLPLTVMASLMGASFVVCALLKFPSNCDIRDVNLEKVDEEEEEAFM